MPSSSTPVLRPAPRRTPPPARVLQLLVGLALCALAVWLSVQVGLGLSPWDVLHAGVSARSGLSFGTVVIAVAVNLVTNLGQQG